MSNYRELARCVFVFGVLLGALISTAKVTASETVALFDGSSLDGWTKQSGDPVDGGWKVTDGMLHLSTEQGRSGNIVTAEEYGDFELRFEWKISDGGNNGIKYRVRQYGNQWLGAEYQILDDTKHRDAQTSKRSTASLYDVYPPNETKYLKPVGEFNESRIVVCGNRLEHWLNGNLVVQAWVGSYEWYERIANSKFSNVENFTENRYGKIMLTDHGDEVWFRKIELTPLYGCDAPAYVASDATEYSGRRHRMGIRNRLRCRRR